VRQAGVVWWRSVSYLRVAEPSCEAVRYTFTEESSELVAKILSGLEKAGRGLEIRDVLFGATALQEGFAAGLIWIVLQISRLLKCGQSYTA
jgi:hypothetical protein